MKPGDYVRYVRSRRGDGIGRAYVYSIDATSIRLYVKMGVDLRYDKKKYFDVKPEQIIEVIR